MPAAKKSRVLKPADSSPADAINRHFGGRVKHLRAERGWSLEELASASGVSRSMLSEIEREQANPTLAVTMRIAQAFGLSLADLLEMPGASSAIQSCSVPFSSNSSPAR